MIDNKVESIKAHIEEIMKILEIPVTESNRNTPLRVAKMWTNELFRNRNNKHIEELDASMKVFGNVDNLEEMVIMEEIEFHSVCEHHWLPFSGKIRVGYVPDKHIIGLSKIPRTVKFFSQKPQLQERLVKEIGEYLFTQIRPRILIVQAVATHDCVMCRGAESSCKTDTIYVQSSVNLSVQTETKYKNEFFARRGEAHVKE